jgi:hypothetical protein
MHQITTLPHAAGGLGAMMPMLQYYHVLRSV